MRILQCFLILSIFLQFTWISAGDETLCVSLYYPYGYMRVGPYQVVPVLTRYVVPVSLKTSRPERLTTPTPLMTPSTPMPLMTPTPFMTPTPLMTPSTPSKTPTTTTARRGDN